MLVCFLVVVVGYLWVMVVSVDAVIVWILGCVIITYFVLYVCVRCFVCGCCVFVVGAAGCVLSVVCWVMSRL